MSTFTSPDIDEKLDLLHREMASLRVECDRLLNKHLIVEHTLTKFHAPNVEICSQNISMPLSTKLKGGGGGGSGICDWINCIESCSGWPPNGAAETSSAYNTGGESCRSVSVTPDAGFHPNCGGATSTQISQTQPSPRGLRRTLKLPSPAIQRRPLPTTTAASSMSTIANRPPTVVLPHDDHAMVSRPQLQQLHRTQPENLDERRMNRLNLNDDRRSIVSSSKTPTNRSIIRAPSMMFGVLKGSSLRKLSITKHIQSINNHTSNSTQNGEREKKKIEAEEYAKRFRIPSYSIVLKEDKRKNMFRIPIPQYFRSSKSKPKSYAVDDCEDEIEEVVDEEKMAAKTDATDVTIHYKWKVKRRCDGSRYIVKRPIRSQILKRREAQLYRERAPISTDDDAMSELKLGRFHTKEERKRILEREKLKKLINLEQKMMERVHPSEKVILQMSQQKMARQIDSMILDEFVTTREMLSSRTRPDGIHGIVSVTTV